MPGITRPHLDHPFAAALAPRAALRPALRQGAAFALGFAGGWAVLYGALLPFGLGLTLGLADDCFAACAAGAALGTLLHGFGALSLDSVCLLCAVGAAVAARWLWPGQFKLAVLCGCGALLVSGGCFALGPDGGGVELVLFCGADALLAGAVGFGLRQFPPEKPGPGTLLAAAALAAALGGVSIGPFCAGAAFCAALDAALCCRGQSTAALSCAAVTGAALCAADPALAPAAAGLCCGAAAAVLLVPGRRIESLAACAGGCVTGALAAQPPGAAFGLLLSTGSGLCITALLPRRWLAPVPAQPAPPPDPAPRFSAAATRLEAVAESLSSLAQTVNEVYDAFPRRCESFRWVIDNTHDTLCFNCGRRELCWQQEHAATLEGMNALRLPLEQNGSLQTSDLPGQLSRCIHPAALCAAASRSFALYRSRKEAHVHAEAMRTALTEQYSAVADALGVLSEQLGRPGTPEPYRSGRVAAFFASLGSPPLECTVTLDDLGRTRAAVSLPRTRFSGPELAALAQETGRLCRRAFDPPQVLSCKGMTTLLFCEKPALRAVFGFAGAAARGGISGDAVQQFCSPTAAQMILCDGMGTGRRQPGRRAHGPPAQGRVHRRAGGPAGECGAGPEKRRGERGHPRPHQCGPLHRYGTAVQGWGGSRLSGTRRTGAGRGRCQPAHRHFGRCERPEPGGTSGCRRLRRARLGRPAGGRHRLGAPAAGTFGRFRCPAGPAGPHPGGDGPRPRGPHRPPRRHHRRRAPAGRRPLKNS